MHQQSHGSHGPRRPLAWVCWLLLVAGLLAVPAIAPLSPASAKSTYHCSGYDTCAKAGYSHHGYKKASSKMWWRMYAGHNCTNYVAYRMVKAGMSATRPWTGSGNATNWGVAMKKITDTTPTVGAVAWWKANVPGAGSSGHVAIVEKVISPTQILISEDSWGGTFHWRTITKGTGWPSGFIHFVDKTLENSALPTMSAAPKVGAGVGARAGKWTKGSTYAYQWLLDGAVLPGATAGVYTPTAAQAGKKLSLRVTATRAGWTSATAISTPAVIGPGAMAPIGAPVVEGTGYVGQPLTATYTGWRPAEAARAVQWYADGVPIAGATKRRLVLGEAQLGKSVTVRITGTAAGYAASTVVSAPVGPVYVGDVEVTAPPALSGETRPGATLRVTPPAVLPADSTSSYTWLRDGAPIAGASGTAYRLGPDDLGRRVSVRVDVQRAGYRGRAETVAAPARVTTSSRTKIARVVGRSRRATVVIRVRVPGQVSPNGVVSVRTDGHTLKRRVVDGTLRLEVKKLRPGTRRVVVTYLGNSLVTPSRAAATYRVRR